MIPSNKELIIKALKQSIRDNYRATLSRLELMAENEESLEKISLFLKEATKLDTQLKNKLKRYEREN